MAIRRTWAVLLAAAIFSMNGHAQAPRAEMVDGFNSGWIHFGVSGGWSDAAQGGDHSACDS